MRFFSLIDHKNPQGFVLIYKRVPCE